MPGKDDIERIVRDMKNFERGKYMNNKLEMGIKILSGGLRPLLIKRRGSSSMGSILP